MGRGDQCSRKWSLCISIIETVLKVLATSIMQARCYCLALPLSVSLSISLSLLNYPPTKKEIIGMMIHSFQIGYSSLYFFFFLDSKANLQHGGMASFCLQLRQYHSHR